EAQVVALGEPERLVHAQVDAEEALPAEVVTLTGLARIWQTEEAGRIGIPEVERERIAVDKRQFLLRIARRHDFAFQLEVGVIGAGSMDAEREAAGPAIDAADFPAACHSIGEPVPALAPFAAVPEGHVVHPVGIDLMTCVEVRRTAKLLR